MASSEMPPLYLRHGVRLVPQQSATVKQVFLAVGEQVGHGNILYAYRMNKAVVVFFKDKNLVTQLIENGLTLDNEFIQVSPLAVLSTRITVSGVPPFIPNEVLEKEMRRFWKFASGFRLVCLGFKKDFILNCINFYALNGPERLALFKSLKHVLNISDQGESVVIGGIGPVALMSL
ncbi:hypothetical protein F2P81_001355 [Scophthalmus maximus]|uniref:Uncharacterized protein n=1 Tax=Scophthalmus maximus TaxID=52904 RepID=A0A6A4U090_SCOMX|nr:hypothetical protein F2P81_001355 [Scophthalmus maximus]